jgi:acetyl-CoA acetyltransferase family protein
VSTRSVYVVDAVRTPIGRHGGALAGVRPDDLAVAAIRGVVDRVDNLDPGIVDDVVLGNSNGAGEENRNVARMAWLLAGYPTSVPAATVNRLCGSGLEAVVAAYRAIAIGDASVCVAGGVESMTRAPWVLPKPERAFPRTDAELVSTTLGWRLVNPRMPDEWTIALGEGAELLAERFGITREEQDELAAASHRLSAAAWEAKEYDAEVVPVQGDPGTVLLDHDEGIRADSTPESLARLRPAFCADGTVTAGNSSQLSDGAAAAVLCDDDTAARLRVPLARIVSTGVSALDPQLYGLGPVEACHRALERAELRWSEIDVVEINEAFAAQTIACLREWPELDPALVNPQGGAIALGHPIGCSGARLLATLAHRMHRDGLRYGLVTMCIGVGQGIAMVLEGGGRGSGS